MCELTRSTSNDRNKLVNNTRHSERLVVYTTRAIIPRSTVDIAYVLNYMFKYIRKYWYSRPDDEGTDEERIAEHILGLLQNAEEE